MKIAIAIAIAASMTSACSKSATPFSADGTVTVDGKTDDIKACDLQGSGVEQAAKLTLASGSVITIPIHESNVQLQPSGASEARPLKCERSASKGSSSKSWIKKELGYSCSDEETTVEVDLTLECGTKGPSNKKPRPEEDTP